MLRRDGLQWRGRSDHSAQRRRHRSGSDDPGVTLPNQKNAIFNRNAIGWNVRANFGFDLASNTAYGPLIGHFDINSDVGNGFDSPGGTVTYVNTGYVTWAGITAGKAQSFFSFIGGGDNWNNFFSPDRKGFNEPNLLAYTASFGGGFTATMSAESQGTAGSSGGGTNMTGGYSSGEQWRPSRRRSHDVWRSALARHRRRAACQAGVGRGPGLRRDPQRQRQGLRLLQTLAAAGSLPSLAVCNAQESKVGWGVDAGVKFNLTGWGFFGAGDDVILTGAYTQNAVWYSGLPDAMNGENGQVNGNGQPMILADAYFNPLTNSWSTPSAWSVSGVARASLDADLLHRSRRLGRRDPLEQHERRSLLGRLSDVPSAPASSRPMPSLSWSARTLAGTRSPT